MCPTCLKQPSSTSQRRRRIAASSRRTNGCAPSGEARSLKLRFSRPVAQQLDRVLAYIAERSPQGAQHVQARLPEIMNLLVLYPSSGAETARHGERRLLASPLSVRDHLPDRRRRGVRTRDDGGENGKEGVHTPLPSWPAKYVCMIPTTPVHVAPASSIRCDDIARANRTASGSVASAVIAAAAVASGRPAWSAKIP